MTSSPLAVGGTLQPGFADPVADSQRAFRALLDAMASPGRIVAVEALPSEGGDVLPPAAAAVALTLVDFETPVWLDPRWTGAAPWLRFHCGAPIVAETGAARFAFAAGPESLPALDRFDLGSDEFPERSTTLVLEVTSLAPGDGLRLRGPGIDGAARLAAGGLAADFWAAREALAVLFPRGLDLVLTCGHRLAALPRTTSVEI